MKYNPDIIKSDRRTISMEVRPDGKLTIRVPKRMTYKEIETFIESKSQWIENALAKTSNIDQNVIPYTEEEISSFVELAKKIIPDRVKYFAEIIGVEYNNITIRNAKTRWGSCSSKRNLNFSCLLTQMSPEILDSVVVHELCHIKEMNHSKKFYAEIYKVMPDYDNYDKWLKVNGYKYLSKLPKKNN